MHDERAVDVAPDVGSAESVAVGSDTVGTAADTVNNVGSADR